jgi:hypothetical protein
MEAVVQVQQVSKHVTVHAPAKVHVEYDQV